MTEQHEQGQEYITLGKQLCMARESMGWSQLDIAEKLHLSKQKILEIEGNDYRNIVPVFARGYLKSYAELLGLNVEDVVNEFNVLNVKQQKDNYSYNTVITRSQKARSKRKNLVFIINIFIVFALILLVFLWHHGDKNSSADLKPVGHLVKQAVDQ